MGKKPHIFRQLFFPGAVLVIVRILRTESRGQFRAQRPPVGGAFLRKKGEHQDCELANHVAPLGDLAETVSLATLHNPAHILRQNPSARKGQGSHVDIVSRTMYCNGVIMPTTILERRQREGETEVAPSSLQLTLDRGTETLRSVLSHISPHDLKHLQVAVNEVDFLVKAAQLAALAVTHVDPTERKFQAARMRGLDRIVKLRRAAEPAMETGAVCELLGNPGNYPAEGNPASAPRLAQRGRPGIPGLPI